MSPGARGDSPFVRSCLRPGLIQWICATTQRNSGSDRTMLQEMRILVVGLLAAVAANAETKAFPSTKHDVKTYGTYEWKNPPRIINAQCGDEKDSPFVQFVRDAVNRVSGRLPLGVDPPQINKANSEGDRASKMTVAGRTTLTPTNAGLP